MRLLGYQLGIFIVLLCVNSTFKNIYADENTNKFRGKLFLKVNGKWKVKQTTFCETEEDAAKLLNKICEFYGVEKKNPNLSGSPICEHYVPKKYKCVFWRKDQEVWKAEISHQGKTVFGGHFKNELDAARRVNQLCEKI